MRFSNLSALKLVLPVLAITALASPLTASAQRYLGSISGEVQDPTGAKIPGAEVTATEVQTKFATKVKSGESGAFSFSALNPGTYSVTVVAPGFLTEIQSNVLLTAGQLQQVVFNLKTGSTGETVEVSADASNLLDTGSANIATTLSAQEVSDLPNEGRNPYVLATLGAGVLNGGSGGYFQGKSSQYTNPFSGVAVQVNADGLAGHNRLTLDGIPNDPPERFSGATYAGFTPSPEAVQEVKVGTSIFDAQVGHGDGTVTNVVVKSGANRLHGAAYYVFQDTYLNANLYERVPNQNLCYPGTAGCTNTVTPTRRNNDQLNQTGFVVDGPVFLPKLYNGRDKTFFMIAFERYASHQATAYTGLMPDTRFRNGDFGELCSDNFDATGKCISSSGRQLYVPTSPIVNGSRTVYFPYNKITVDSTGAAHPLDPAGQALLSYLPCQNAVTGGCDAPFSPGTSQNYIGIQNSFPNTYPSIIGRLDQSLGAKNKFSVILFHAALTQSTPLEGFPKGVGPSGNNEGGYVVSRRTMGGSIDDVHQFNSTTVLDSRFGITWHPFSLRNPYDQGFDLSSIHISNAGLPYSTFPGITNDSDGPTLTSGASGSQNASQFSTGMTGSLEEILSKTFGRHTVRFGFEGNLLNYNAQTSESGFTGLVFDRTFTQLKPTAGDSTSGNSLASLLLGYQNAVQYSIQPSYALHQIYTAPFVQDDWRVNDRLTLNLGVRWDYESPFTERYNKFVDGFCTTCANPLSTSVTSIPLTGGLQYATANNRQPYAKDLNNWQPRIGVAYQLSPKTVVRAGYGIIYFNTIETPVGTGFSQNTGNTSTGTGGYNESATFQPITTLDNPFPNGVLLPTGNSLGLGTAIGSNISFIDPNHVQPKAQQISASLQQEFVGGFTAQIAYVNNRPSQLEINQDINALPQQYYSTSTDPTTNLANQTYLNTPVANPLVGKIPTNSTLNAATIQRQLLLKPFPEFGSVTEMYRSIGHQRYDALQVQVSMPMKHHVSFQGSFTWNKLIDWTAFANNFGPGSTLTKVGDPGPTLFGNVFGTVELPRFATRPFYERLALGGWKLNTVMRAQNGNLIGTAGLSNGITTPVDLIGDPLAGAPRTFQRMFNTCYEDQTGALVKTTSSVQACDATSPTPAFRQRYSYTTQTAPLYINERQRIYPLVDLSLFKQFLIREGVSLEVRGEFFNVANRPNFGGPSTSLNSSTYGVVVMNQANDPRTGQLTARLNF